MLIEFSRSLAAIGYGVCLTTTLAPVVEPPAPQVVPILEVIKVYGKLAGPSCFGKTAPAGSSCQVTRREMEDRILPVSQPDELAARLEALDFAWPLKPYGVEKSEYKTAVMNKGAETRLYMEQLEERGLYDRRNPTGPLPTSLRPKLNQLLQQQGVDPSTVRLLYEKLAAGKVNQEITSVDTLFQEQEAIDYYDFLEFLGKTSITWD